MRKWTRANQEPIEGEEWRVIPDFPNYEASNMGRIRNSKGLILQTNSTEGNQYQNINLNSKTYYVHRIIAMTFIPNPDNLPEVNHKNEIKNDNRAENLEWCTRDYNLSFGSIQERHKAWLESEEGLMWRKERAKILAEWAGKGNKGNKHAVGNKATSGLRWVTNGEVNKCIPKDDPVPEGFHYGVTRKLDKFDSL